MTQLLNSVRCCSLLLVLAAFLTLANAQSPDLNLSDEELAWITDNPVIKVGGQVDWGPFDFTNARGQYTGLANEMLNLISERTGLQFEIETDSWANLLRNFEAAEIDLLPAIYFTEERSGTYNFASRYQQVTEFVFARDDAGISSADDLPGKTAGMISGFASIETLQHAFPDLEIIEFCSLDEAIDAVVTYRADILFDALATLSYTLRQKSIASIRPIFTPGFSEPFDLFMASRTDMPELASITSKVFDTVSEAEKQAIVAKWLSSPTGTVTAQSVQDSRVALTAMDQTTDEEHGFELGAADYITKPVNPPILQASVRTHLELKRNMDELQSAYVVISKHKEHLANLLSANLTCDAADLVKVTLDDVETFRSGPGKSDSGISGFRA